ncbi:MAG: sulfotransferase [Maricaulaceae bacterium]
MTAIVEDLRRSARTAFDRTEHERLNTACQELLSVDPHDSEARRLLGLAAMRDHRPDLAEPWLRETAARKPDDASSWRALAGALAAMRRESEAEALLSAAAARGVQTAGLLVMLANLRLRLGLDAGACEAFEAAIAADPVRGEAYWGLAVAGGLTREDPIYAEAEKLIEKKRLEGAALAPVLFALAEAERRAGEADAFMARIVDANQAQRARLARSPEKPAALWRNLQKRAGDLRRPSKDAGPGSAPMPVFLIGEPCCGAELAEAMLAGEPGAFAAGEINLIRGPVLGEIARLTRRRNLDEALRLKPAQRDKVRAAYFERARRIAPKARWFIDRSPGLAAHAASLRALFPEAAIVRLERPGVQQGLDIYRRYWTSPRRETCDLAAIGDNLKRAHRAFHGLARNRNLDVAILDAEALIDSPLDAEPALREAAKLPPSLSSFSSKGVRRARSHLARFGDDFVEAHARTFKPLVRALG